MIQMKRERPRVALYSHDTMGLGHVRRNMLIARKLSMSRLEPNILLLSGAMEAKSFYMPAGVDCITLPSLYKDQDGVYKSRRLRVSLDELVALRRKVLRASVLAFDPDLLIVDAAPRGAAGELDSTLEHLVANGHTYCVLGTRDVWDEAAVISSEWTKKKNWEAVRDYYNQVWVYGDPTVYDLVKEYQVEPGIAGKFRYTGYLGRTADLLTGEVDPYSDRIINSYEGPYVLCMMGGGQDGVRLAEAFLEAELPRRHAGLLLTGPHMSPEDLRRLIRLAKENSRMRMIDFVSEPLVLIRNAESIISMGGYNGICEVMSLRKHALIVPRIRPRKEQLIRAERLRDLGVLDVLPPGELTPEAISRFVVKSTNRVKPQVSVDLCGLTKVLELAETLMTGRGPDVEIRGPRKEIDAGTI